MQAPPTQRAIKQLEAAIANVPKGTDVKSEFFHLWQEQTGKLLSDLFGAESPRVKRFKSIRFTPSIITRGGGGREDSEAFRKGCGQATAMLAELRVLVEQNPEMLQLSSAPSDPKSQPILTATEATRNVNDKVFLVHGHDGGLKNAVARFIAALGLEPVILHERPDRGQTVMEKFERESNVGYAIVLATADDLADSRKQLEDREGAAVAPEELNRRARQNVIFELGYFVGKLGRGGVSLVVDKGVELPSDLSGVIYVARNDWKTRLYVALGDAGYEFTQPQSQAALNISE